MKLNRFSRVQHIKFNNIYFDAVVTFFFIDLFFSSVSKIIILFCVEYLGWKKNLKQKWRLFSIRIQSLHWWLTVEKNAHCIWKFVEFDTTVFLLVKNDTHTQRDCALHIKMIVLFRFYFTVLFSSSLNVSSKMYRSKWSTTARVEGAIKVPNETV